MRKILTALLCSIVFVAGVNYRAIADYAATAGSGLTFGSVDLAGIKFPAFLVCDFTTAKQCAAVKAASTAAVATDPALVARIADGGDVSLGAKADAHTCSSGSAIACLGQIDDDVKSTGTIKGAGTAGTADTGVVTIQGIASMTKLLVTPDSVALPANQSVNTSQVNGVTVLTGTGATGTGAQRVTVSTDQATNAGAALVKGGVGVVNGGSFYQAVAASQTATVLQSSTGATGDYLSHCVLYPTSTSPGVVTVFDNTNAAGTSAILFPGGATSLSNLAPISIPVGAVSTAGAWKVTTGASISVVCYGKFS